MKEEILEVICHFKALVVYIGVKGNVFCFGQFISPLDGAWGLVVWRIRGDHSQHSSIWVLSTSDKTLASLFWSLPVIILLTCPVLDFRRSVPWLLFLSSSGNFDYAAELIRLVLSSWLALVYFSFRKSYWLNMAHLPTLYDPGKPHFLQTIGSGSLSSKSVLQPSPSNSCQAGLLNAICKSLSSSTISKSDSQPNYLNILGEMLPGRKHFAMTRHFNMSFSTTWPQGGLNFQMENSGHSPQPLLKNSVVMVTLTSKRLLSHQFSKITGAVQSLC